MLLENYSCMKVISLSDIAMFDPILSILLRRRVRAFCKSILVPCDEDTDNTAVKNPTLIGIESGLL